MKDRIVPATTIDAQAKASRPDSSAWVSANAGSGKTHVLTQRVIRLLLAGVPASKILCLTFTKAAAANMSLRIFNTLARWTALDDAQLQTAITATGSRFRPELIAVARKLFTRTIESPGGLKIQTIHGFCESVLHCFPFESNTPAGFDVIDDERRRELLEQAKAETFVAARADERLGYMLQYLSDRVSGFEFDSLIDEALRQAYTINRIFAELGNRPGDYRNRLSQALGLAQDDTRSSVVSKIVEDAFSFELLDGIAEMLGNCAATDKKLAERIYAYRATGGDERLDAYIDIFFSKGKRRGATTVKMITKAAQKADPMLLGRLEAEADRLEALIETLGVVDTIERSEALITLAVDILRRYQRLKRAWGVLDFDDLIERTLALLSRCDAAWVLYKLDSGIDHILVDEAQDTSDRQWRILEALSAEFTSGEGRTKAPRTFFAVGDEKQSIFSFQGAEPRLFDLTRRKFFNRNAAAALPFQDVRLNLSFRSGQGVLDAVDAVFAVPDNRRGLSNEDLTVVHEAWKRDLPALVEIWDPIGPQANAEKPEWLLPLDSLHRSEPAAILAERIADLVARLLDQSGRERVFDEKTGLARVVRGGDIMILLRRRGVLFEALIRALKHRGLPVAGADRLILKDHIAIMDLLALGRFCLLPEDDLSLACVLKSPLLGLDDDDLIAIAPERKGSLFAALCAGETAKMQAAAQTLLAWRMDAHRATPFEFYSAVVEAQDGRGRFLARLGDEAGDALDEFLRLALTREGLEAPSLQRFIEHIEAGTLEVKRDMEAAGRSIRVMTVHASKGLEARIVMLPDTCATPGGRFDPRLFLLQTDSGAPVLAWSSRARDDCAKVAAARKRSREELMNEYRRLLYVGMTRAEERLYVMGYYGARAPPVDCWHTMVRTALESRLGSSPAPWNAAENIWRMGAVCAPDSSSSAAETDAPACSADLPEWLYEPVVPPRRATPLRPSRSLARKPGGAEGVGQEPPNAAIEIGTLIHGMLRFLPSLDAAARRDAARVFLDAQAGALSIDTHNRLIDEAIGVIDHARLRPLFAAGSVPEAPVSARVVNSAGVVFDVAGRIDRVASVGGSVWFADFKTGFHPQPPPEYIRQIALYAAALASAFPDKLILGFLVWTRGPHIVEYSHDALRALLDE